MSSAHVSYIPDPTYDRRRTSVVSICGNVVDIENDDIGLTHIFQTRKLSYVGPARGLVSAPEPLLRHPSVRANAGLLPIIRRCLCRANRLGECIRYSPPPHRLELSQSPFPATLPLDIPLLQFVREQERGLVILDRRNVSEALLIAEMAAAYPGANIRIVAASRAKVRRVGEQLQEREPTTTIMFSDRVPQAVGRLVVGTFTDMAIPELEFPQSHVVIFLDARHAEHERAQLMLLAVDSRYRLFGFVGDDEPLSGYERDWMMATFGPHEVEIPRHEWIARTVHTAWSPIKAPYLPASVQGVELLRLGCWSNPVRNRRVAHLARAAAAGNRRELLRYLEGQDAEYVATLAGRRTILVAANIAHVLNIGRFLPGWPVAIGPGFDDRTLPAEDRHLLRAGNGTWPTGERAIVTLGALPHADLGHPDILIWAAGGVAGGSALRHRLSIPLTNNPPMVAIDFDDRHSVELRRLSRQRRRNYHVAGWYPVGIDQATGRIIQFLAARRWSP